MHSRYRISHHAAGPEPGRVHQGVRHPGHLHAVRSVVAVNISTLAPALRQPSTKTTICGLTVTRPGGTFNPSEAKTGLNYLRAETGSGTEQSAVRLSGAQSCDLTEGLKALSGAFCCIERCRSVGFSPLQLNALRLLTERFNQYSINNNCIVASLKRFSGAEFSGLQSEPAGEWAEFNACSG